MSQSNIALGSIVNLKITDGFIIDIERLYLYDPLDVSDVEGEVIGFLIEDDFPCYFVVFENSTQNKGHLLTLSRINNLININAGAQWIDNLSNYKDYKGCWVTDECIFGTKSNPKRSHTDSCACKICRTHIQYAEPNQPDNTFICYSCIQNPMREYY